MHVRLGNDVGTRRDFALKMCRVSCVVPAHVSEERLGAVLKERENPAQARAGA